MKKNSILILLVVFIGFFQSNLFSIILSRVEGVVFDQETNQPIKDVSVSIWVYNKSDSFLSRKITTDVNGKFILNDIPTGEYFIMCEKGDYQTFSPFYYLYENDPIKNLNVFYLEEGKIKHFDIKMARGGKLKVNVFKKNINGISPFEGVRCFLLKKRKNCEDFQIKQFTISAFITDNKGTFLIDGLAPGDDYIVSIKPTEKNIGLLFHEKQIEIIKSETTEITKMFDFTDNTGVTGKISFSSGFFDRAIVFLVNINDNSLYSDLSVDNTGVYSFLNVNPGSYKLVFYILTNQEQSLKKETVISIEENKQKVINAIF